MKNWENSLASSMMYQDLGDCSIVTIPVIKELDEAKEQDKKNALEIKVNDVIRKAGLYFALAITLCAKFA